MEQNILSKEYMIPDVENKEDYQKYKVMFFRSVPQNNVLICRNRLTGDIIKKGKGLRMIFPWWESKFMSIASKNIDYPPMSYRTKDGLEVKVDMALSVKIEKPLTYEVSSQNPLQELGIVIKELMRSYVASKTVADLDKANIT